MSQPEISLHWMDRVAHACPMSLIVHRIDDPEDDRTFRIVYANKATEAHLGVAPSELAGRLAEEVFPSLREKGFIARLVRVLRTGQAEDYEDFYFEHGQIAAIFAGHIERVADDTTATWFENVTRRKQIEGEAARAAALEAESLNRATLLAELEAAHRTAQGALDTYDLVADAADVALWEIPIDPPGAPLTPDTPCRFSKRFAELVGRDPSEIRHEVATFLKFVHPDDAGRVRAAFMSLFQDATSRMMTSFRVVKPSGEIVHVQANGRSAAGERGSVRKAAGALRDITAQVAADAQLRERLAQIERQQSLIEQLSTPLLAVWDDVIALPVVGTLDGRRAQMTMEALLREISEKGVRFALLDLTGVETIDTATAEHVARIAEAVGLLGARAIITGIQPAVAQTMVQLGVNLEAIQTRRNLRDGLRECLERVARER
jgi:PAS domain S-box-containing protein